MFLFQYLDWNVSYWAVSAGNSGEGKGEGEFFTQIVGFILQTPKCSWILQHSVTCVVPGEAYYTAERM